MDYQEEPSFGTKQLLPIENLIKFGQKWQKTLKIVPSHPRLRYVLLSSVPRLDEKLNNIVLYC